MTAAAVSVPFSLPMNETTTAGAPVLAIATGLRLQVMVTRLKRNNHPKLDKYLDSAVAAAAGKYPDVIQFGWRLEISGEVGSASLRRIAVVTGAVAGLVYLVKGLWNPRLAQELVYPLFKNDGEAAPAVIAACIAGGVIWSRRELPFLTSVWQLPITIPDELQKFSLEFTRSVSRRQPVLSEAAVKSIAMALKSNTAGILEKVYGIGLTMPESNIRLWYGENGADGKKIPLAISSDGIRLEEKL